MKTMTVVMLEMNVDQAKLNPKACELRPLFITLIIQIHEPSEAKNTRKTATENLTIKFVRKSQGVRKWMSRPCGIGFRTAT